MARIATYKQVENILNDYCTPTKIKHRRCEYIEGGWETELVYCIEKDYFEEMIQELQKIDKPIKIEEVPEEIKDCRSYDYEVVYLTTGKMTSKRIKLF